MNVAISPRAERDIENIGEYIARDNPWRSVSFVLEMRQYIMSLPEFPDKGAQRDQLRRGMRMLAYGQYLIFYWIDRDAIRVERVLHSARRVEGAFN